MAVLSRTSLLTTFNAQPYSNWGGEDDALLGEDELRDQEGKVLDLTFEQEAESWAPISCNQADLDDARLPQWFLDGSVTSLEIAGGARDALGYPRVIRAGQMGVGATCANPSVANRKMFWRFVALNAVGYSVFEIEPLRQDLNAAEIPQDLVAWQPEGEEIDLTSVRSSVRVAARDEMLDRERMLVMSLQEAVYVDGRFTDHADPSTPFLVVGIIKSQRARFLSGRPLQVLYELEVGQRTPGFLILSSGRRWRDMRIVTFYVRLTSPALVGPGGGLVRVEMSEHYFVNTAQCDFALCDRISSHLCGLRTQDATYSRGAVTLEPIRQIERELHLIFRDTKMVALDALHLLQG